MNRKFEAFFLLKGLCTQTKFDKPYFQATKSASWYLRRWYLTIKTVSVSTPATSSRQASAASASLATPLVRFRTCSAAVFTTTTSPTTTAELRRTRRILTAVSFFTRRTTSRSLINPRSPEIRSRIPSQTPLLIDRFDCRVRPLLGVKATSIPTTAFPSTSTCRSTRSADRLPSSTSSPAT